MEALVARWREEATRLRTWGASVHADVLVVCAAELEAQMREHALEALTLEEAVRESGYSYSSLQKMLAKGEVENAGMKGNPRVRRMDLPKKAGVAGPDLAERILASRFC
jgi:hypothetical protein